MATIKSFTSLEQSKKLAEILPLESADMRYHTISHYNPYLCDEMDYTIDFGKPSGIDIPCWSLAALLNVLPRIYYPVKDHPTYLVLGKPKDKWCALYWDVTGMQHGEQTLADTPIDACYEMIIRLNELKML